MIHRGDDLDDDFVADDTVALSGDEDADPVPLDEEDVFLHDDDDDDQPDGNQSPQPDTDATAAAKKRKRREKDKERKAKKRKLAEPAHSVQVAAQSPSDLASYLASVQAKAFPKLSPLELEDRSIPDSLIHRRHDLMDWTTDSGPSGAIYNQRGLNDAYAPALPNLQTRLSQKSKSNGAPTLLYIASAALRVADITRVLKNKKLQGDKGAEVAKLFAKHFKLEEHVSYLKKTKIGSAVGTPGRLGKLLADTDALSVSALSHIILDVSYQDAKTRTLLDIPETRDELFKMVLANGPVLKGIREGKIQVVLF